MKTLYINVLVTTIAVLVTACSASPPSETAAILTPLPSSVSNPLPTPTVAGDPFTKGVDKAASATNLAQSAQTPDDWRLVMGQWQRAIAFMKAVPASSPNHKAAQKLLRVYQQALVNAQQQAKHGGSNQTAVIVNDDTKDGIPLIVDAQPKADPTLTGTALTTINTLLQQQTEFFANQKRFATSLTDLGSILPAETPSYTYSTSAVSLKQVIATATANQENLPSYTGTIFLVKDDKNNETTTIAVCLTSKPSKTPPATPQLVGKEIQCSAGATKV